MSFWPSIRIGAEHPEYFWLLLLIPLILLLGIQSLAGLGPVRRVLVLAARTTVIGLLVLALTGPAILRESDDQAVIFVLDTSASVSEKLQKSAFDFVSQAVKSMRPSKDRVGVVAFNGVASVEQLPGSRLLVERLATVGRADRTDLAAGVRLGVAVFPPEVARRIVLISDGNENVGDVMGEAERAAANDIPIDVMPLSYTRTHEVVFERIAAPATARLDEAVRLNLGLRSTGATTGRISVFHNDTLLDLDPSGPAYSMPVQLSEGANRLALPLTLRQDGVHRYRARFEADDATTDTISSNNEAEAFTIVAGRERVLIVANLKRAGRADDATGAELIAAAMRRESIETEVVDVGDLRLDATSLLAYSCIVLSNVSAFDLPRETHAALGSFVRDMGGGLIVIGGDQSLTVGGYQDTVLSEILPVEPPKHKMSLLSVGIVAVIDRSGSMAGQKLQLAKLAAKGAVKLLTRLDRVGVVAFDSAADWVVPFGPAGNTLGITESIDFIGSGGGTNMYPGLEMATVALRNSNTHLRHVILLTDGQSEPGPFEKIANEMKSLGITLSTIAIGQDADLTLLRRVAQITDGRSYVTNDPMAVPQIFARETMLASREGLFERTFLPTIRGGLQSPLLAGFSAGDLPQLGGHVVTKAKPSADVPLVRITEDGADPILAHWQVGLGRAAVFTSGMWNKWGPAWSEWPGFSKFWTQAVRWASRPANSTDFTISVAVNGDTARLVMEAAPQLNIERTTATLEANVVDPSFRSSSTLVQRVAPNRFEASFPVDAAGNYLIRVAYAIGKGPQAKSGIIQTGISYAASLETRNSRSNEPLLESIAQKTGGRVLRPQQADAPFEQASIHPIQARLPIWGDLVRAAIVMFLLDVALRRIAINPSGVWNKLFAVRTGAADASTAAAATIGTLRQVRAEIRTTQSDAELQQAVARQSRDTANTVIIDSPEPLIARPPTQQMRKPMPQDGSSDSADAGTYSQRLLDAKRRAREAKPDDHQAS